MQALAQGDLSERARKRALELANDADLRIQPLRVLAARDGPAHRDPRLPPAGTVLRRSFDGQTVEVRVLEDGFEYAGQTYGSVSAIASKVAGTRWNGFSFFGLTAGKEGSE